MSDVPALRLLYDTLSSSVKDERTLWQRIALAFEIKLGLVQSLWDLSVIAGLENRHWVPIDDTENLADPLLDPSLFAIASKRARASFSLIVRVRAIWDKMFVYIGTEHGGAECARRAGGKGSSRKAFLNTLGRGVGPFSSNDVEGIRGELQSLEEQFRTPELHGAGSLRSWAYDPIGGWPVEETTILFNHWNKLNSYINRYVIASSTAITSIDDIDVEQAVQ